MSKKILFLIFVLSLIAGCRKDKYIANRFSGVYEITKIQRETWDSTGKISEETLPCGYTFYLEAPEHPDFGNGDCRFDTIGTQPGFLNPLGLNSFSGLSRFSCEWNIGPGDNVRLSFVKPTASGIGENSVSVNIKRNAIGKVIAWTFFVPNSNGGFVLEEYEIKIKRIF